MHSRENVTELDRRQFIRTFVLAGASSCLLGQTWAATVLAEVQPLTTNAGILRLRLSDFPALGKLFGSVRIGTSPQAGTRPSGLFSPILVNRGPAVVAGGPPTYFAVSAECTHEGCTVPVLNSSSGVTVCPCHGSRFDYDGRVLARPATMPLLSYQTTFDGQDTLTIELPDLAFRIEISQVSIAPGRVELQFLGFENLKYEVQGRESLDAPWKPVRFSTTPTGPVDQSAFTGKADIAKLYVPVTAENTFLAVALRTQVV
jgi:nitrite reductase/ring-hydroxylating ferredoxin subunit